MKIFCLFFALCSASLFGGIENYFKSSPYKNDNHKMRNIDFIYTINLDQRPEKFLSCTNKLDPYGIHPYRFSAVNGWELTLEDLNNLGVRYEQGMNVQDLWGTCYLPDGDGEPYHELLHVVGRNYFSHCMSRGAVGIVLSHLSVLQDALDSGYETIWVMEDDIDVVQNPHKLSILIDKLDSAVGKHWDILFTDRDTKDNNGHYVPCYGYARKPNFTPSNTGRFSARSHVGPEFTKVGARYGAYSMIIRRSGMQKILNFIKKYKIFLPYDMEFYLPNNISMYAVTSDVISTVPGSPSDNGAPRYKESLINN